MSTLAMLQHPVTIAIGWMLIHSLWIGLCAAILMGAALPVMRSASATSRYVVLFVALLLIPTSAAALTLAIRGHDVAATDKLNRPSASTSRSTRVEQSAYGAKPVKRFPFDSGPSTAPTEIETEEVATSRNTPVNAQRGKTLFSQFVVHTANWIPWLVLAWMVGVTILSVRLACGCFALERLLSTGTSPVSGQVVRAVSDVASHIKLRRAIRILESALVEVPTTIGLFRPLILLPLSTITNLSAKELESILAHELAHIHRNDFLMNCLQTVVEILLFYHPAIWWISHRIRQERENACDDTAIQVTGDRLQYARALAEVAAQAQRSRLALAASGGQLSDRIKRILGQPKDRQSTSFHVLSASLLAVTLISLALLVTNPTETTADNHSVNASTTSASRQQIKPIAGTILGPGGEPLSGVTVFLRRRPFRSHDSQMEIAQQSTGADGTFEFRGVEKPRVATPSRNIFPLDVIAMKSGHSMGWKRLGNAKADIRIQLRNESTFRGILNDDAGNPVANASIRVLKLMSLNTIKKIDVANGHTPSANGDSFLDISESVARISARTNERGEFVLHELPNRVGFVLGINDRRFVDRKIHGATSDEELPRIPAGDLIAQASPKNAEQLLRHRILVEMLPIHKSPATLPVMRGVRLRLRVLNDVTGKPVSGATIISAALPETVVSDANGYCDLFRLKPNSQVPIQVVPPETASLFRSNETIALTSQREVERDMLLKRGAVIVGRVIDARSRTGVEKVWVEFVPEKGQSASVGKARFTTSANGDFRMVVPATSGRVIVSRAPSGYVLPERPATDESGRGNSASAITASLETPVEGILITLEPRPAIRLRFSKADRTNLAVTVALHLYYANSISSSKTVEVGDSGTLDIARYVSGSRTPKAFHVIARSADDRLAAFFRTRDVAGLQGKEPHAITLRPVASVRGRLLDSETKFPIPGARVSLTVQYTATRGQGVGEFTCDKEGRYQFDDLVPGMEYHLGARASGYASLNSIHTKFVANDGKSHSVDISLTPNKPSEITKMEPVKAPSIAQLDPATAFDVLVREYANANKAYRDTLKKHESDNIARQIVSLLEPTPVYAPAFMQLANDNRGSTVELKALKWLCNARLVAGTEQRYRHLKQEAATRLLRDYHGRAELADMTSSVIYAAPDRYEAARILMNSPHHEVQGRACIICADIFAQRYRETYHGGNETLRKRAIELYQKVIDQYADVSDWRYKTIAVRAKDRLFELTELQFGAIAPEIEGVDLNGKPMKLSDFRGNVVVIHYWESRAADSLELERIAEDYQGKPLVIVGVNTDKDRNKAIEVAKKQGLAIRHWYDPDRKIHARWSNSWPNTHVIGHDGKILYKGQRQSRVPLDDVLDEAVAAATRDDE